MSTVPKPQLSLPSEAFKRLAVPRHKPYYQTHLGAAYLEGAPAVLQALPSDSVNAIVTSPPYALHFKKEYGNVAKEDYVEWFLHFAHEFFRNAGRVLLSSLWPHFSVRKVTFNAPRQ